MILTATRVIRDQDRPTVPAGRYVWRGPAGDPVFAAQNCRELQCDNVDVVCETPTIAVFLSERTKSGPGTIPPTMAQFRNVRVFGNGLAASGFWYRATIDENNEHMRADCVSVYGCGTAWDFDGQQSKEHLLTHCRAESCHIGVAAESSFQWIGGTIAAVDCAFAIMRVGDPVTVQGVGVEACKRLLWVLDASTDSQPITLTGVRYAADQLHEDGGMIVMRHAGPLTIIGGSFGDGAQRVPQIHLAGIGEQAVSIIGAKFGSYGADATAVIRTSPGVRPTIHTGALAFQRAATADGRTTVRAGI